MANSFISLFVHVVFSVKNRKRLIAEEIEREIWQYLGGICRAHGVKAVQIGGVEDHVHLLLGLPATLSLSDFIKRLKGESSKWISATFPALREFNWQDGYGGFSVGQSQIEATVAYIKKQREHHHRKTFEEEYRAFLQAHGIEVEEKYIFG
jgi:REP element-mobilizing transposase RayT